MNFRNTISALIVFVLVALFAANANAETVDPAPVPSGFYLSSLVISGDGEIEANMSFSRPAGVGYFQTYMSFNKYGGNVTFITYDPVSGAGLDEQEFAYLMSVVQYGIENALNGAGVSALPSSLGHSAIADRFITGWVAEGGDRLDVEKMAASPEKQVGWHVISLGQTGDYELSAEWLRVREDGSIVKFESVYRVNDKGIVSFLSWFEINGNLTENEVIYWSNIEPNLRNALNGGGLAAISGFYTNAQVDAFITAYSGCGSMVSYEDGSGKIVVFEDCSSKRQTVR